MSETLEQTILQQLTSIGKALGELSAIQNDMQDVKSKIDKVTDIVRRHDDNLITVKESLEDIDNKARLMSDKYKEELSFLKQEISVIYVSLKRLESYDKNIKKISSVAKNVIFNNKALKIVLSTIFTAVLFGFALRIINYIVGNPNTVSILDLIKQKLGG